MPVVIRGLIGPRARRSAVLIGTAFLLCRLASARPERPPQYLAAVERAIALLEEERHPEARDALAEALRMERNEPIGLMALGALHLHTGTPALARVDFARARELTPDDPLLDLGEGVACLIQGDRDNAQRLLARTEPLRCYLQLIHGGASEARTRTARVGEAEPDPLQLEMAAFAALRGGDPPRGERLLRAFLARPDQNLPIERAGVVLTFLPERPAQPSALPLAKPLSLPDPVGPILREQATLQPDAVPDGTALVRIEVDGANLSAMTNTPPFGVEWNTSRIANGIYNLRLSAYDAAGRLLGQTLRAVRVANYGATNGYRLPAPDRDTLRSRLQGLLMPHPARKAAHFALAERAVARRDGAEALARIESVVAVDPNFRAAFVSLKRYHREFSAPAGAVWRGQTQRKWVALTFDDGPNPLPHKTPALLDSLQRLRAAATFFVVGQRAQQAPQLLRRMVAEGHEIGNHSYSHPNLTYLTPAEIQQELCRTTVIVRDITGRRPAFYRPPGGNFNGPVSEAAGALGMSGAYWTVDAYKFERPPFTPEQLAQYVLKKAAPGAVILLHNAPETTIAALPNIVTGLRERGYELVTMSELVRRCKKTTP